MEQDTSARAGGGDGGQAEAEELAALRGQVKASIYALMGRLRPLRGQVKAS